jgi:hypothetical protein
MREERQQQPQAEQQRGQQHSNNQYASPESTSPAQDAHKRSFAVSAGKVGSPRHAPSLRPANAG